MTARLDFLGAVGTVTGSRFLVSVDDTKVIVDCGLFQGLRELRRRNWEPFPVAAEGIGAALLTHAHLDHSGYLPALVRQGFRGPTYLTQGTAQLAKIVLLDSAHLLEEDADNARRHGYSKHDPPLPLYTEADVRRAVRSMRPVALCEPFEVAPGWRATLRPAGHILGSSSVRLELAAGQTVLFSGDLGRPVHPLLNPPPDPPASDVVVVESTYGDRRHEAADDGPLGQAITRTVRRGGSVVIPAFAVDRTEVILMALRRLRLGGVIPDVPVYVDSPMALAALQIYREAIRRRDPEVRGDLPVGAELFDPGNLHEAHSVEESKALNAPTVPSVILSASGMATGGRVLHHLEWLLPNPRNTVVLAGYQTEGTRGRALLEGARSLKIHGRYVPVRAEIVNVPTYSVHADADEIVAWLGRMPQPPQVCYVVHGEPGAAAALRDRIERELQWTAVVPRPGERVLLD